MSEKQIKSLFKEEKEIKVEKFLSGVMYLIFTISVVFAAFLEFNQGGETHLPEKTVLFALTYLLLAGITVLRIVCHKDRTYRKKAVRQAMVLMFWLYCIFLGMLLFVDGRFEGSIFSLKDFGSMREYIKNNSNFVPFKEINRYINTLAYGHTKYFIKNILGNLVAFMPFGVFVPLIYKEFGGFIKFFLLLVSVVFLAETMQLITVTGCFDVDDIILNVFGALAAFIMIRMNRLKQLIG